MAWISHDQNFKNLILDYRREAIEFFAPQEAAHLDSAVDIQPIRQEQLKDRLSVPFRELDVPLLARWPDGGREAIVFALEDESRAKGFSIHRLAHYCLDLSPTMRFDYIRCPLEDNEQELYRQWYPEDDMTRLVFSERHFQRGQEAGVIQGLEQGARAGEAKILKRLLSRKFGPLSDKIADRIDQASSEQLELWFDRAVKAETDSLDGVFAAS